MLLCSCYNKPSSSCLSKAPSIYLGKRKNDIGRWISFCCIYDIPKCPLKRKLWISSPPHFKSAGILQRKSWDNWAVAGITTQHWRLTPGVTERGAARCSMLVWQPGSSYGCGGAWPKSCPRAGFPPQLPLPSRAWHAVCGTRVGLPRCAVCVPVNCCQSGGHLGHSVCKPGLETSLAPPSRTLRLCCGFCLSLRLSQPLRRPHWGRRFPDWVLKDWLCTLLCSQKGPLGRLFSCSFLR